MTTIRTITEARQVPDDLNGIYEIAQWIYSDGGKLTDPLHTFDCAFKLHGPGGDTAVQVGDWVIRVAAGEFAVAREVVRGSSTEKGNDDA